MNPTLTPHQIQSLSASRGETLASRANLPPLLVGSATSYKYCLGQAVFHRHETAQPIEAVIFLLPARLLSLVVGAFHSVDITLHYTLATLRCPLPTETTNDIIVPLTSDTIASILAP